MVLTELILGIILAVGILLLSALWVRKRYLLSRVGGIQLALRNPSRRWSLGIARYVGDELLWFRGVDLSIRPVRTFARSGIEITGRREPTGRDEATLLPAGVTIVQMTANGSEWELGLPPSAATGFLSWLESAAPDTN